MTQIIVNETDFPKKEPEKIEDFIAGPEETAVFFPVLEKSLPIKREFENLFPNFYKNNKKEVHDYCAKIFVEK